jgi:LmbE family N-acetylglucosaminyl deacetylase
LLQVVVARAPGVSNPDGRSVLVVVPNPDSETLGCGALLASFETR